MSNEFGIMSTRFYRIAEWIWRLAYLNLLWLLFTVAGLGVLGIFPATVAMYTVLRKWLQGEPDIAIFPTFFSSIKQDFFKANGLGYILVLIGFILFFNYEYLGTVTGIEHTIISIFWYLAVLVTLILAIFLFPVYVHFSLPFLRYFKTSLIIALVNPLAVITLILALGLAFYLFYIIPGFIPFYLASVIGWIIMWNATLSFQRLERKQERIEEGEESAEQREKRLNRRVFSWKRFQGH